MADPILDALDRLIDRIVYDDSVTVDSWAAEARAIRTSLAAQPPAPAPEISEEVRLAFAELEHKQENLRNFRSLRESLAVAQPPAPAASITPDLDALLSPEGAYERWGTGQEPGAQLVSGPHGNSPEWWVPLYGCDTLDNLLDRLRTRILPHLRPPVAGIDVPGGDGDYGGLQELCDAEGVDVRIGAPLLRRARDAWRQTERLHRLQQENHRFREPAPAVVAVAVDERPWERDGWCDAEGRCWAEHISREGTVSWRLAKVEDMGGWCARVLPAHAIPQPPQGEEVAQ